MPRIVKNVGGKNKFEQHLFKDERRVCMKRELERPGEVTVVL
jgi:hypothetical protein